MPPRSSNADDGQKDEQDWTIIFTRDPKTIVGIMRIIHTHLIRLLIAVLFPVAAQGAENRVHEYNLENGLKIIVQEDRRAPVVVSQIWYRVGASFENDGITGISHVLEHMMFKGTDNHPPGEFSRIIASHGGRENAFTGRDYTAYFQRLEQSRLPISFELEADRMRGLNLSEKEFAKELQVVLEERRMRTEDNPQAKTYEHFLAMAYSNSPYKNPIIGWPADLHHLRLTDLDTWYKRWYAPNNAVLVVVGDVAAIDVYTLAKRHFAPLKPSEIEAPKPREEIPQLGKRRMTVKIPAKTPYLIMGYKVPVLAGIEREWEAYALEVLAGILDAGNSSRLAKNLVRGSQVSVSASAGYDLYARLPSLFTLTGIPVQGKTLTHLEKAFQTEIHKIKDKPVKNAELDRVKAQVMAQAVYERDSIFYQAMQLGLLETVGLGWRSVDDYVDRVNAVTARQVQSVALKYLVDNHLNVAYMEPLPLDGKTPVARRSGGRHAQ